MADMERAYSLLETKSIDEERRIIHGVATTITPDRIGDIVESRGAQFRLPIPFLAHHKSELPIGEVVRADVSDTGIQVEVHVKKVTEPGPLKDRLDLAWQEIKHGLVKGLSIGFKALDAEPIQGTYGQRFLKWLWLELSAVTVPANGDCSITHIRAIDTKVRAALGNGSGPGRPVSTAAAVSPNQRPKEGKMNVSNQIAAFETQRTAKALRFEELAAAAEGRTKTAEERTEFDTLKEEITAIDAEIDDLRAVESITARRAQPANGGDRHAASESRQVVYAAVPAQPAEKDPNPELHFVRWLKCRALSQVFVEPMAQVAGKLYGTDSRIYQSVQKAAVAAGTTASGNWGYDLISQEGASVAFFLDFLRARTIVGRFGTNGIPSLNMALSFYQPYVTQVAGGTGYWVGQALPKPLTSFDFDRSTLTPLKMANIAVLSNEHIKYSSPQSDMVVRDALVAALVELKDTTFIDPSNAGTANVEPASITNGAVAIAATGTGDADDIRQDVRNLIAVFTTAHNPPDQGVLIMGSNNAVALAITTNPLGQPEFPTMGRDGGTLLGFPVIVSNNASTNIVMVNAKDIAYRSEGMNVDVSTQASLEMLDSALQQSGAAGTGASLVSLWQNNLVGFRAEETVNWKRLRTTSVAYITGAAWGGAVST